VTVYYSCQVYLYCTSRVLHIWLNESLYLLNINTLTRFLRLQTTEYENVEPCEQYLLERNVSVDEAKLFDQYQNLFECVRPINPKNIGNRLCLQGLLSVVKFIAERGLAFGDDENVGSPRKFFEKIFNTFFKQILKKRRCDASSDWFCNSFTNRSSFSNTM